MKITIICPLYNGERYIEQLDKSIKMQKKVEIDEIKYLLTISKDNSIDILNRINANYSIIQPEDFSHSLSREKAVYESNGDIIVFITQDIIIKSKYWLYNLVKDIDTGICEAAFSKQICDNNSIERYTRMKNYPNESRIASKENLSELGIMAYFYSDASSAIKKEIFIKLNGYDGKDLLTNEDMYIAYKLIQNGYRIKYCAKSEVIHSHKYSLKSLFNRYFDQGVFLKQHEYINNSGANEGAIKLLKYVIRMCIKERNFKVLVSLIPNFGVRFIANKYGQRYKKMSKKKLMKYSSNIMYWRRN